MRKVKSQLVLVSLLVSLLLASCGGGETLAPTAVPPTTPPEPTEAPEPTATPEPTEVPAPGLSPETAAILEPASAYFGEDYKLITAEALYENLNDGDNSNDPYILDIRKAEDYDISHVPGATNVDGGAIFTEETLATLPEDGQIVVYCYTGQTAGQVVGALNTLGYDAYSLKFGMPSWAIAEGASRWNDDMSMAYPTDTEAVEMAGTNDLPAPLGATAAEAALAYFGEGFKLITAEALYENLNDGDDSNDPFVIDIRKPEDYAIGYIPGAVNVGGGALFNAETLAALPTDGQVVVTCYSGQTAGQVVGVLNMLGYDAYSLKFGMPSWAITEGASLWNDGMSMSYPVEGGVASFLDGAAAYFGEEYKLITAEALYENLNDGDDSNDPVILDIRKPEDYVAGHVPGAINMGGGAVFSEETLAALPADRQIVVYCYTGQTAGQVVGALNTLGYDAYSLKFGMPSWAIAEGASRWNDDMSMGYPADTEAVEMAGDNELPTPLGSAYEYFSEGFQLITAEALYENLNDGDDSNDPFVIDIRKPEDYAIGHVPGAVNVGGGELFNAETLAALPTDEQVVVTCYSGQTAGQVVGVLNMLGYDAYSLKFGMPSWAITEGVQPWNDGMSMGYPTDTETHTLPGAADGGSFLDGAATYFGEGYKLITAEALYENLNDGDDSNDPVILDIRKAEDYAIGHVTGAVNMSGSAVFSEETLAALPTDGQVVVYCYTGQTAGQVVGALNTLGYDAYSLKFGMPSWAIAEGASRWNDDTSMGYPADTEAVEMAGDNALPTPLGSAYEYFSEDFQLITAEALYENLNDGDDSNDPYILDIRSGDDYAVGHIPGAVNVGGGVLFNAETLAALPTDGQVVVTCYSGQTAGQVVGVLNMLGYDAYSLKFGYPSWTTKNVSQGLWGDDMSMGYPVDTEAHELP